MEVARLQHGDAPLGLPRLAECGLRLVETVLLDQPLRVRQVDLRRVGGVLLDDLQRVVPHVVLEVEREQPCDVSQLQQQLARVRVRLR